MNEALCRSRRYSAPALVGQTLQVGPESSFLNMGPQLKLATMAGNGPAAPKRPSARSRRTRISLQGGMIS